MHVRPSVWNRIVGRCPRPDAYGATIGAAAGAPAPFAYASIAGPSRGLGIAGSIVGGVVAGLIWKSPDGKFHPAGWVLSIIGAALLLWLYNQYAR
jgi:MFS superfamily sulfate permease-like transporter